MEEILKLPKLSMTKNYNISSDQLEHPLLKPLLTEIQEYFREKEIRFFLIGATARDIIMSIHNEKPKRLTNDLDIAIAIEDWSQYQMVEDGLTSLENFDKDPNQKQRFIYLGKFQLDIVPFGSIMTKEHKIFWPPDQGFAMSVLGFNEVDAATIPIELDGEFEIPIASLAGIFILKIAAFKDRSHKDNKDADDMAYIITNYLSINQEKAIQNYEAIYETEDFTIWNAGSKLLGIDISDILKDRDTAKQSILEILKEELMKAETSRLINQFLETHRTLKYEEVYTSLLNIIKELEK